VFGIVFLGVCLHLLRGYLEREKSLLKSIFSDQYFQININIYFPLSIYQYLSFINIYFINIFRSISKSIIFHLNALTVIIPNSFIYPISVGEIINIPF